MSQASRTDSILGCCIFKVYEQGHFNLLQANKNNTRALMSPVTVTNIAIEPIAIPSRKEIFTEPVVFRLMKMGFVSKGGRPQDFPVEVLSSLEGKIVPQHPWILVPALFFYELLRISLSSVSGGPGQLTY